MAVTDSGSTPRLEQALGRFKAAVIANGLTEAHFLPPVPADQVQAVFDELELPLHPDIATLYAWSDGYANHLGRPHRFLGSWHIQQFQTAGGVRAERSEVFYIAPYEADLWPVFSIDYAMLCVHTVDGSLWEMSHEESAVRVNPSASLADLYEFWGHLHEAGYYELVDDVWHADYEQGVRDYGDDLYTLHAYR